MEPIEKLKEAKTSFIAIRKEDVDKLRESLRNFTRRVSVDSPALTESIGSICLFVDNMPCWELVGKL